MYKLPLFFFQLQYKVQLLWTPNILQPVQTLVRVERLNAAGDEWQSVDADSADLPNQCIRVRAVHDGAIHPVRLWNHG